MTCQLPSKHAVERPASSAARIGVLAPASADRVLVRVIGRNIAKVLGGRVARPAKGPAALQVGLLVVSASVQVIPIVGCVLLD